MTANLTQILNFKANFHQELGIFLRKNIYANIGGHFKIVSIIKKTIKFVHIRPYNLGTTTHCKNMLFSWSSKVTQHLRYGRPVILFSVSPTGFSVGFLES